MKQVDRGDPRWVMAYWISQKVSKTLIRPCQQFWRIFQVKYFSHDSTNQYCSNVILDEFCELLHLICKVKVDMKWKFLFSDMIVEAKPERRLLTVSWYLFWFQRYRHSKKCKIAQKVVHLSQKFGETMAKMAKFVTSVGLHVSRQIMWSTIT